MISFSFSLLFAILLLGLGGLLVLRLARSLGHDWLTTWIAVLCWCASGFTLQALWGTFSLELFYPLFLFGLLISRLERLDILFWVCAVLFLGLKADAAIYLSGYSIFLVFSYFYPQIDASSAVKFYHMISSWIAKLIATFLPKKPYNIPRPVLEILIRRDLERKFCLPTLEERKKDAINGIVLLCASAIAFLVHFKLGKADFLIDAMKNVVVHPILSMGSLFTSAGFKFLYLPMLFIPLFNLDVLFASIPFFLIYSASHGSVQEYQAYFPIGLWIFALYGLLENRFLPRILILAVLILFPLWHIL